MKAYTVTWLAFLEAEDEESAAKQALEIMQDPKSKNQKFYVMEDEDWIKDNYTEEKEIDLYEKRK